VETLTTIFFYILAVILITCALCTICARKIVSSVVFSLIVFLAVSGIYFLMNASFNAAAQVVIYGAAVVLLFFVVIFTLQKDENSVWIAFKPRMFVSALSLFFVFLTLAWALVDDYLAHILDIIAGGFVLNRSLSTVYVIGEKLLSDYAVVFELSAIMLFVLVVGLGMVCVLKRSEEG